MNRLVLKDLDGIKAYATDVPSSRMSDGGLFIGRSMSIFLVFGDGKKGFDDLSKDQVYEITATSLPYVREKRGSVADADPEKAIDFEFTNTVNCTLSWPVVQFTPSSKKWNTIEIRKTSWDEFVSSVREIGYNLGCEDRS
jgi:hypothetical protein